MRNRGQTSVRCWCLLGEGQEGRDGVCVHSALHSRHMVLSENIGKGAKVHGGGGGVI